MSKLDNYPPGVTGNEPQINGDDSWEDIHNQMEDDASNNDMSDLDVSIAWKLGLSAWKTAVQYGAKFPHSC